MVSPPPLGIIKINVDGAYQNSRLAAAAVARDHRGEFLDCATAFLHFGSPIEAEAATFQLGIDLVLKLNATNVIIEGDSMEFVRSITDDGYECDWGARHQIYSCRSFRRDRDDITSTFSPRSTNGVAHALAASAITSEVTDYWIGGSPPLSLMDFLLSEMIVYVS